MKEFFDAIRPLLGPFNASQVDGIENLVVATEGLPLRHRAYILATAWHETGGKMQPVREKGSGDGPDPDKWDDYLEQYDTGPKAAALGNTPEADGDGVRYAGRGFVQITGRNNYERAGRTLGLDLIGNPDLALNPATAAQILVRGMVEGWFTSKKLDDYQTYKDMRRVVNGTDRADLIAGYAAKFERGLVLLPVQPVSPAPGPVAPEPPKPPVGPSDVPANPKLEISPMSANFISTLMFIASAVLAIMAQLLGCTGDDAATAVIEATKCTAPFLTPELANYAAIAFSGIGLAVKAFRPGGMLAGLFGATAVVVPETSPKSGPGTVTPEQVKAP